MPEEPPQEVKETSDSSDEDDDDDNDDESASEGGDESSSADDSESEAKRATQLSYLHKQVSEVGVIVGVIPDVMKQRPLSSDTCRRNSRGLGWVNQDTCRRNSRGEPGFS